MNRESGIGNNRSGVSSNHESQITNHFPATVPTEPNQEIHIFPLNTVLFPDGVLPLKVFEQRYIEMTKA